jgi:hypothetical protein
LPRCRYNSAIVCKLATSSDMVCSRKDPDSVHIAAV